MEEQEEQVKQKGMSWFQYLVVIIVLIGFIVLIGWVIVTGGQGLRHPCELCAERGFYCVKNTTTLVPLYI